MGQAVIVPRRAMCSPVIEPLGFLPPTICLFLYVVGSLHCNMENIFGYFVAELSL